ncbi:MAG: ATP-binding cassette domain-containing protein [Mycoplasma sp.]|nr:ATP-binding cassette domain-containing protein [Mycoplasma sp.]
MQIKTKNISHTFGRGTPQQFNAIQNVDSEIKQGQAISIIGHTGSGKTTYIEHLNALLRPTSGELIMKYKINSKEKQIIRLNKKLNKAKKDSKKIIIRELIKDTEKDSEILFIEKNIRNSKKKIKNIKQIRKKIGVVFQFAEYQLFEDTIEKDIMFGPLTMGDSIEHSRKKAKKYLELVGMPKSFLDKSPFELSGGQKRRVALAGILAMEPDMLVFDEPTAGLDPQGSKEILDIFTDLNKKGKTIVIVTHNLDDALERTKITFMFSKGKLIKIGDTYEILKDINLLKQNNLEPPKILEFAKKLEDKGIKLPKVTSIKTLAEAINEKLK